MKTQKRADLWLRHPGVNNETRAEILRMDESAMKDAFYKNLEFGTGGMRGIMGAGDNRINTYTISRATRGLSQWVKAINKTNPSVVIAYDTRNNSADLAETAAKSLVNDGISVYLFNEPTPTPVLSFSIRHLGCTAGVVITASHNPREYNGYKVYNSRGGQITPTEAKSLMRIIEGIEILNALPDDDGFDYSLLQKLETDTIRNEFLKAVLKLSLLKDYGAKQCLSVVYTPIHGTGISYVPNILALAGFARVSIVREQESPDGNFPTVSTPNPEDTAALSLGILQAMRTSADIVIGTDPDCDRIGVAVRCGDNYRLLNGNQTGALLADYILSTLHNQEALPDNGVVIKTIVTSDLGVKIAGQYGIKAIDTLTGFKYIGEKINEFEQTGSETFIFGYEESFGYLAGTHARDKDAVVSSMLICEAAAYQKTQGKTLCDRLEELFKQYGYYLDAADSFNMPGTSGMGRMDLLMQTFRTSWKDILPSVRKVDDYAQGVDDLPLSNVLRFSFNDGSWMAVRPSGTEPKIKFYYSIHGETQSQAAQRLEALRLAIKRTVEK